MSHVLNDILEFRRRLAVRLVKLILFRCQLLAMTGTLRAGMTPDTSSKRNALSARSLNHTASLYTALRHRVACTHTHTRVKTNTCLSHRTWGSVRILPCACRSSLHLVMDGVTPSLVPRRLMTCLVPHVVAQCSESLKCNFIMPAVQGRSPVNRGAGQLHLMLTGARVASCRHVRS